MDSKKIKELMRDQISSLNDDITKKMNYLINSELLDYNYYKIDIYRQKLNFKDDSDLLNAFIGNNGGGHSSSEDTFANAFMSSSSTSYVSSSSPSSAKSNECSDVNDRISNINSRLAALRGISMPGDYLRNKG